MIKNILRELQLLHRHRAAPVRKFYNNNSKNVWGKDIKIEYPKKPDVITINDFKKDLNFMRNFIFNKITKIKKLKSFMI